MENTETEVKVDECAITAAALDKALKAKESADKDYEIAVKAHDEALIAANKSRTQENFSDQLTAYKERQRQRLDERSEHQARLAANRNKEKEIALEPADIDKAFSAKVSPSMKRPSRQTSQ